MVEKECIPKKGKINIVCWTLLIGGFAWSTFLGATNIKYDKDIDGRFSDLRMEMVNRDSIISRELSEELKEINKVQNEINYRLIRIETKLSKLVK